MTFNNNKNVCTLVRLTQIETSRCDAIMNACFRFEVLQNANQKLHAVDNIAKPVVILSKAMNTIKENKNLSKKKKKSL